MVSGLTYFTMRTISSWKIFVLLLLIMNYNGKNLPTGKNQILLFELWTNYNITFYKDRIV